ncbi:hypothetical protein [Defluviimonas sp. WL0075]|uniref:hypothetical protein n=1 Tax=Albidovulum sediminicola TaxID=2984331 RepID=UPI0021E94661|nr:hypothetical protein [Defluviimonas sp. WL0075]
MIWLASRISFLLPIPASDIFAARRVSSSAASMRQPVWAIMIWIRCFWPSFVAGTAQDQPLEVEAAEHDAEARV